MKSVFKTIEGKQQILNYYDSLLERWDFNYKSLYLETSFGKTHMIASGDKNKPAILLLHGSSTNSAMWVEEMKTLSERYYVIAIDILGEPGKSDEVRLDLKSEEFALWIDEVIVCLGLSNVSLVGNSLGGWVALKYAIRYPEKVKRLILIAPSGIAPAKGSFIIKAFPYMLMGEKGLNGLNKIVYGNKEFDQEVLEVSNLIMKNFIPRFGSLPVFSDDYLELLLMPVLYIAGEKDALLPTKKIEKRVKKYIVNSETEIIKDNGHVVTGMQKRILRFIDKE